MVRDSSRKATPRRMLLAIGLGAIVALGLLLAYLATVQRPLAGPAAGQENTPAR